MGTGTQGGARARTHVHCTVDHPACATTSMPMIMSIPPNEAMILRKRGNPSHHTPYRQWRRVELHAGAAGSNVLLPVRTW